VAGGWLAAGSVASGVVIGVALQGRSRAALLRFRRSSLSLPRQV
jgi:hypothetical protein